MAFLLKDRVKETSTTTGTGAFALGGASATFDTFSSVLSDGDTTYYAIVHAATGTDEWEVGLGTLPPVKIPSLVLFFHHLMVEVQQTSLQVIRMCLLRILQISFVKDGSGNVTISNLTVDGTTTTVNSTTVTVDDPIFTIGVTLHLLQMTIKIVV